MRTRNRAKEAEYNARYRARNRAKIAAYRARTRAQRRAYDRAYAAARPELIRNKYYQFLERRPGYYIWYQMLQRCNNPSHKSFKDYGERGINVCTRWHDYDNWAADMLPRPHNHQMHRLNNREGYCPENVEWVDIATHARAHARKRWGTSDRHFNFDHSLLQC